MPRNSRRILYITHDGLTDNIGESQVLPYLLNLSSLGYSLTLLSAEKKSKAAARGDVAARLADAGITWRYITYHNKPPLVSTAWDLAKFFAIAKGLLTAEPYGLIHCRSFLPTMIGLRLKRATGVPVLFDFRDFWAERRLHANAFKFVYKYFRNRQGRMLHSSDHVVVLTANAKRVLTRRYFPGHVSEAQDRITVIPTCVDELLFDTRHVTPEERKEARASLDLPPDRLVLGYLGTFEEDYIPSEMFRAYRALKRLEPKAMFVFVSPSSPELIRSSALRCGIDPIDVRVIAVRRREVPRYIAIFDLSLVFVRPDQTTAGVSPTKLAELFACNVPVLATAGVGDLDEIVSPERNDSVLLHEFTDEAMEAALRKLLAIVKSGVRKGRSSIGPFTLEEGVRRYESVYRRFVTPVPRSC